MDAQRQNAALGMQLYTAALSGNTERVRELLDQGVTVDFRVNTFTPLFAASHYGHSEVVTLLLDRGADVNATEDNGFSILILSAFIGQLDVVQILAARGANIHYMPNAGYSALLWAALFDRLSVCECLLSRGADLMAANTYIGLTLLSGYGQHANPPLSDTDKALRCAALEAAWAVGPHPSQVQRRKDERWARRWPFAFVLVTRGFRPLQYRLAAASPVDPVARIPQPLIRTRRQRHAHLLSQVLTNDGIVRLIVRLVG